MTLYMSDNSFTNGSAVHSYVEQEWQVFRGHW